MEAVASGPALSLGGAHHHLAALCSHVASLEERLDQLMGSGQAVAGLQRDVSSLQAAWAKSAHYDQASSREDPPKSEGANAVCTDMVLSNRHELGELRERVASLEASMRQDATDGYGSSEALAAPSSAQRLGSLESKVDAGLLEARLGLSRIGQDMEQERADRTSSLAELRHAVRQLSEAMVSSPSSRAATDDSQSRVSGPAAVLGSAEHVALAACVGELDAELRVELSARLGGHVEELRQEICEQVRSSKVELSGLLVDLRPSVDRLSERVWKLEDARLDLRLGVLEAAQQHSTIFGARPLADPLTATMAEQVTPAVSQQSQAYESYLEQAGSQGLNSTAGTSREMENTTAAAKWAQELDVSHTCSVIEGVASAVVDTSTAPAAAWLATPSRHVEEPNQDEASTVISYQDSGQSATSTKQTAAMSFSMPAERAEAKMSTPRSTMQDLMEVANSVTVTPPGTCEPGRTPRKESRARPFISDALKDRLQGLVKQVNDTLLQSEQVDDVASATRSATPRRASERQARADGPPGSSLSLSARMSSQPVLSMSSIPAIGQDPLARSRRPSVTAVSSQPSVGVLRAEIVHPPRRCVSPVRAVSPRASPVCRRGVSPLRGPAAASPLTVPSMPMVMGMASRPRSKSPVTRHASSSSMGMTYAPHLA